MKKLVYMFLCTTSILCASDLATIIQEKAKTRVMLACIEQEGPFIKAAREAFLKGEYEKFDRIVKERKRGIFFMPCINALLFDRACDAQGVKKLASIGCDVNIENQQGITPLMVAAGHVDHDKVKELLIQGATIVNQKQPDDITAVHFLVLGLASSSITYDADSAQKASDIFVILKEHAAAKSVNIMNLPVLSKQSDNPTIKDLLKERYTQTQDKNNPQYDNKVAVRYDMFVKALQAKGIL